MAQVKKIEPLAEYNVLRGIGHFFENKPLPLDFVFPGLLAQSVGVLVAAGSTGKSFLAIELAMSVAWGCDIFKLFNEDDVIKPGPVAYIALEDPLDVFWTRIHNIADYIRNQVDENTYKDILKSMENVHLHELYGAGYRPMDTDDLTASAHMTQTIAKVKEQGARLVIIDTYSRFLAGHSESDNAVASTIVSIVEQLCKATGAAVLILHHTNKASQFSGEQGNQGAARGASALTDNARYQMNMWKMPPADAERYGVDEEERKFLIFGEVTKANHMAPQGLKWIRRMEGGVLVGVDPEPELEPRNKRKKPENFE